MTESNKDNLEQFFQKKAQNPDIDFNEADWENMEARLDREMPVPAPWFSLKKLWPIPIFIILGIIGWNYFNQGNTNTGIENHSIKQNTQKPPLSEENSDEQTRDQILGKDSTKSSIKINLSDSETLFTSKNNDAARLYDREGLIATGKSASENNRDIQGVSGYVVKRDGDEALRLSKASSLHSLLPIPPKSAIFRTRFPEPETAQAGEIVKTLPRKSNFIIGIGYSPDFSTVGIGNFVSPGSRWKLYLEYNYKNVIALSSGFEWVNNKYEAYGDEYHAPQRYWHNGIVADEAYGECIMIDIPVNIRFQAFTHGRHQLFLSGGLSSYFLLKEDYYFHYDQNDPDLPQYWGTDKMSIYPFGIINASLGYEYLFKSGGSIQLEPYIKIPTQGVGWGKVDLYTIGAYFSYRYRLIK